MTPTDDDRKAAREYADCPTWWTETELSWGESAGARIFVAGILHERERAARWLRKMAESHTGSAAQSPAEFVSVGHQYIAGTLEQYAEFLEDGCHTLHTPPLTPDEMQEGRVEDATGTTPPAGASGANP